MSIAEIRQRLHQYIDKADDSDVTVMYSFLEQRSFKPHAYSEEELNEFYRRREKFPKGESKGYSVEEVHNYIRQGKMGL